MNSFYRTISPDDIPIPSEVNIRIIEACTQKDSEVEDITRLIQMSPSISARLLSLVNSPFFGFSQKISSVSHAVVAMGLDAVKNLTLCMAIKESFAHFELKPMDSALFWKLSTYRAVACQLWYQRICGSKMEPAQASLAFTLGLLADIGLLVMFIVEADKRDRWDLLLVNGPETRLAMEQDVFGTTHCDVGVQLIEQWHLPHDFIDPIQNHHQEACENDLTRALLLADWSVALFYGAEQPFALTRFRELNVLQEVGELEQFIQQFNQSVQDISEAMELSHVSAIDLNQLYQNANLKLAQDNISYQELTWRLQTALKERDEYAQKLTQELAIAREIQQSLQSDISYREHVAAINIPAKTLSGDFFDYYEHHNGIITFCLGDVSGKGTHAALVMAKTISLFRCLSKVEDDLQLVVRLINDEICETSIRGMFVTFCAGRLDLGQQKLEVLNAGHIPPIVLSEKAIKQIEAQGPPLGVVEGFEFVTETVSFDNHRLYLYTDGITEARKDNGEELGSKEFIKWILESKRLPLKEQMDWLRAKFQNDIKTWEDDLTLMMLSSEKNPKED
jgi:serine phosphatase RsbU (regulator of sigma subunit)/HD-like signal output (HDOD) protein